MGLGQVEVRQGVGRGVVNLIGPWKCVEKSKSPRCKTGTRGTRPQWKDEKSGGAKPPLFFLPCLATSCCQRAPVLAACSTDSVPDISARPLAECPTLPVG